jgi:hypothetical protein
MNCPKCYRDLSEKAEQGATTGMWTFRIVCDCGQLFRWQQGRIFAIRTGNNPLTVSASR